jgi:hypothetical protein
MVCGTKHSRTLWSGMACGDDRVGKDAGRGHVRRDHAPYGSEGWGFESLGAPLTCTDAADQSVIFHSVLSDYRDILAAGSDCPTAGRIGNMHDSGHYGSPPSAHRPALFACLQQEAKLPPPPPGRDRGWPRVTGRVSERWVGPCTPQFHDLFCSLCDLRRSEVRDYTNHEGHTEASAQAADARQR